MAVRTAAIALVLTSAPAFGSGYFNMPTSLAQCVGLGWGPGYHAPLLLGPCYKARIATQDLRRLPAPLGPPPAAGFSGATVLPHHQPMAPAAAWHAGAYAQPAAPQPIFAAPTLAPADYVPGAEVVPAPAR